MVTMRQKALFRACLHEGGGPQVGEVTRLSGLHDKWSDPQRQVARSARPGNPLSRVKFYHVNVSRRGNPPSRGPIRDTSNSRKIHFGGGFASLLKLTIESHHNRPFPHSCKQRHQFEARVDKIQ